MEPRPPSLLIELWRIAVELKEAVKRIVNDAVMIIMFFRTGQCERHIRVTTKQMSLYVVGFAQHHVLFVRF
jgi:hypothetical protein